MPWRRPGLTFAGRVTYDGCMAQVTETVRMSDGGRIVIPATMREQLGLKPGDDVILELDEGQIRLMTRADGIRRAQRILARYVSGATSLGDELIAERRAESARD